MKKKTYQYGFIAGIILLLWGCVSVYMEYKKQHIHEDIIVAKEIKREKRAEVWLQAGEVSEELSPLYTETEGDSNLMALCFETPRVQIQGQTNNTLQVIVSAEENGKTNTGGEITADDLLFNLYLRLDPSMGTSHYFGDLEILGQKEFFYGTTDLVKGMQEVKRQCEKPSRELLLLYQEKIVRPALKKELRWVKTIFSNSQYANVVKKYQTPKDLFAHYFSYQTKYSSANRTEEQVLEDIVSQYGGNLSALAKVTGEDYTEAQQAFALARSCAEGKSAVNQIAGIKKLDKKRVLLQITSGKETIDKLEKMWLLPLSQYGKTEKFDGVQNFGFPKGNVEKVLQLATQKLAGSGFFYKSDDNKDYIFLKRNPYAEKGKEVIRYIKVLRHEHDSQKEMVHALNQHSLDMAITEDSRALNKMLSEKEEGTIYHVRKKKFRKGFKSTCFVYRTSYLNTTTFPKTINHSIEFFQSFGKIKVNPE